MDVDNNNIRVFAYQQMGQAGFTFINRWPIKTNPALEVKNGDQLLGIEVNPNGTFNIVSIGSSGQIQPLVINRDGSYSTYKL